MDSLQQAIGAAEHGLIAAGRDIASLWVLIQLGVIALTAALAVLAAALVRRRAEPATHIMGWPAYPRLFVRLFFDNLGAIIFVLLLVVAREIMSDITWPSRSYLIGVAASLTAAWVVIALAAGFIRNPFVYRLVAVFFWTVAALNILGLIRPVRDALDSFAVVIGGLRVSPLLVIKATVLLLLTLWAANATSDFLERRVRGVADLTPSIQVLIGKLIRLLLITFAILVVLSSVGIDFSALAFFSGAIGVGLGFGLQKIVSNLVSGIILLADKSIKPGDVITVGDSFGWVGSMGARYTSVVTRDGREYLIPNEDFVTQRVINWSYSNDEVRLDVEFGVAYASDPHKVIALALEAVRSIPRLLEKPPPVCYLKAFGNSSLDFVLRFWIRDPIDGLTNVRGAVMLALWDVLKREGVEIPFPQRDLNPRGPFHVVVEREAGAGKA